MDPASIVEDTERARFCSQTDGRTDKVKPGGHLNIKMLCYQYRDSHVKYKTVSPTVLSLTRESPYLGKMVFILRRGQIYLLFNFVEAGGITKWMLGLELSWTHHMMTSSNGNIFRVTGPLCGEFTGHRWIPCTKASDAKLWCFLWTVLGQTFQWTIVMPVIWDAIGLIMTSL